MTSPRRALLTLALLLPAAGLRAAERAAVVPVIPSAAAPLAPASPSFSVAVPLSFAAPSLDASLPALRAPQTAAANAAAAAPTAQAQAQSARVQAQPRALAAAAPAASAAEAKTPVSAMSTLSAAAGRASAAGATSAPGAEAAPLNARLDAAFDGSLSRKATDSPAAAVVGRQSTGAAPLGRRTKTGRLAGALAAAGLLLLPTMAFAASPAGPITAAQSLSWLSAIHPLASAGGAVLGAIYGMFAARSKDGETSAGDVLASALRYGVVGGASVYALMDLTQLVFVGPGVGLKPLSSAVATAALGRAAFQGKFADAATTSADRIIGAFPAVAAALGLSIGINMVAPPLTYQLAMTAMAVTGVLTAVYAAIFKPGRSPADGPALMGKGFVLQTLMWGLALALSTAWQAWAFTIMGAAGVGLILWAFGRELWSLRPAAKP